MKKENKNRGPLRILQFLSQVVEGELSDFNSGKERPQLLSTPKNGQILCSSAHLKRLHKASSIIISGHKCRISPTGLSHLKRALAQKDGKAEFQAQHRSLVERQILIDGKAQVCKVNANESPLFRLYSRRFSNGKAWLSNEEFVAGERLRSDFTKGHLMQKVTANWDSAMGAATKRVGAGGMAELSDMALDARERFHRAIATMAPDLSGVLTDVCCYLKGLETVEKERQWPPRSAKLMLRAGLDHLVSHYGLEAGRRCSSTPQ